MSSLRTTSPIPETLVLVFRSTLISVSSMIPTLVFSVWISTSSLLVLVVVSARERLREAEWVMLTRLLVRKPWSGSRNSTMVSFSIRPSKIVNNERCLPLFLFVIIFVFSIYGTIVFTIQRKLLSLSFT